MRVASSSRSPQEPAWWWNCSAAAPQGKLCVHYQQTSIKSHWPVTQKNSWNTVICWCTTVFLIPGLIFLILQWQAGIPSLIINLVDLETFLDLKMDFTFRRLDLQCLCGDNLLFYRRHTKTQQISHTCSKSHPPLMGLSCAFVCYLYNFTEEEKIRGELYHLRCLITCRGTVSLK